MWFKDKLMSDLVIMKKDDIYTTSLIISENLKMKHEHVIKMLKRYSHIENLSGLPVQKLSTKGRAIVDYLLNEEQALLLVSLMKNTPEVIDFKLKLVRAFIKYRNIAQTLAIQKQNSNWLLERVQGKSVRLEETDVIKKFVNYATDQGSKSANMYYMNITKMENNALFFIEQKFENLRDVMNINQLHLIRMADKAIEISLNESMELGLHYKECFKRAKEKVEMLAKIFHKSPLLSLLEKSQSKQVEKLAE